MKHNIFLIFSILLLTAGLSACTEASIEPDEDIDNGKILMSFAFSHPSDSRVTDTSFENGDAVGLYVSKTGKSLEIAGNTINNEKLTYTGSAWLARRPLYWDAGDYDIYAYYPHINTIGSITDLAFEVSTDQHKNGVYATSGYEASDFLVASARDVTASDNPVSMQFRHIMSKLTVRLIKGEDFEGEIPEKATVYIHNTVTAATIDLRAGVVTKDTRGVRKTVIARQVGTTSYAAILVPQRIENRVPLIEVVINDISLLYEGKFQFKPGMHHIISLIIDKNPDQVKIELDGRAIEWN